MKTKEFPLLSREARIELYGSMLYCPRRDTLCLGQDYNGDGHCLMAECVLDDPEYQRRKAAQQDRQRELAEKHERIKKEEKEAAAIIRTQNRTSEKMERYYTKGQTRLGDKTSRELAKLERRLKDVM